LLWCATSLYLSATVFTL